MKKLKKLHWTLFDRTIREDDGFIYDRFGIGTAMMISYPKIWKIGNIRSDCGCCRKFWSKKKNLICLDHVREKWSVEDD